MRLLVELLLAVALIVTAWETPYHERLSEAFPMFAPPSAPADPSITQRALPVKGTRTPASPPPSGAWMWEKERKTSLDRPAYNDSRTFTGHVFYKDEAGKQYWIDGEGKRHYE